MIYAFLILVFFLIELIYFRIASYFNIVDKPNQRSSHSQITLRGGGILFPISMLIYALVFGCTYPFFFIAIMLVSVISFIDDVHPLHSRLRLVFQFLSMFLLFQQIGVMLLPWWVIVISLILFTGIINAFNFMDGINGITGGYSIAVLLPLIYLNTTIQYIDMHLLWVALIAVMVFNFFNFRKKARCFAGDVGSISIAFIVIFALGLLILKTQNIVYLLLLGIYGVDSVMTITHRILLKEHITQPHRKHMYQLMANELHIPHVVISSGYAVVQLLLSAGLIYFIHHAYSYAAVFLLALAIGYIVFMKKYFHLHQK